MGRSGRAIDCRAWHPGCVEAAGAGPSRVRPAHSYHATLRELPRNDRLMSSSTRPRLKV